MSSRQKGKGKERERGRGQGGNLGGGGRSGGSQRDSDMTSTPRDNGGHPEDQAGTYQTMTHHSSTASRGAAAHNIQFGAQVHPTAGSASRSTNPMDISALIDSTPAMAHHPSSAIHGAAAHNVQSEAQVRHIAGPARRSTDSTDMSSIIQSTQDLGLAGTVAFTTPASLPRQGPNWNARGEEIWRPPSPETRRREEQRKKDFEADEAKGRGLTRWGSAAGRLPQHMMESAAGPSNDGYQVPSRQQIDRYREEQERKTLERQGNNERARAAEAQTGEQQIHTGQLQLTATIPHTQGHEHSEVSHSYEGPDKTCLQCYRNRSKLPKNSCNKGRPCSNCIKHGKRCVYSSEVKARRGIKKCNSCYPDAICSRESPEDGGCERCHNMGFTCTYSGIGGGMAQQSEALKACGPCSKRKVRCDQNTPCANCTNRNENCTRSRKEQFKEPIGIQGPDPYPTRPSRSEPVAERLDELDTAPGWIARRSGDQFFSDWLLHPTSNQVPAGTPLPEGGIGGPPIGFDLRYGQWVYKRPYGSQLPSMVVGVNQRGDWAYALDQQSDPSVATGIKIDHMITDPLALETRVVVHPEVAREAEVEILQGDGGQKMANRAEARMSSVQSRANKAISRQVNVKVYDLLCGYFIVCVGNAASLF
ncbi:hypothetical protein L207DRAFT_593886 [Hyaloscypha variabilis F]|uniref:Zn(2)-C6 fungal-type domain-containing protein n=1 Tax=Hyaloscypha variabilis (strain UAMH 11265 / GT02V1 / F) TaxID=1149755 RepID=A0A2J6QRY8_HYAVF|nr:hypothetical protein L207DRAFT_593886 [Hyaloscypha variabilis F]